MVKKKLIKIIIIVIIVLCFPYLYIENLYSEANDLISKNYYYKAVEILEKIRFYRNSNEIINNEEVKFNLAIETLDISYLEDGNITIPNIVDLNASRVCCVLEQLGIDYVLEYFGDKSKDTNAIISYSVNKNNNKAVVYMLVNDYYCNSIENVIYANHPFVNVTEKGEYLYISHENCIYRSKPNFEEIECIYCGDDIINNLGIREEKIYFLENQQLFAISICGGEKELICDMIVINFVVNSEVFLINAYDDQSKCVSWMIEPDDGELSQCVDEATYYTYYDNQIYAITDKGNAVIRSVSTGEEIKYDITEGYLQGIDVDRNIIAFISNDNSNGRSMEYIEIKNQHVSKVLSRYSNVMGQACFKDIIYIYGTKNRGEKLTIWTYNTATGKRAQLTNDSLPRYFGPYLSVHGDYIFSKYSGKIVGKCYNVYTDEFVDIGIGLS